MNSKIKLIAGNGILLALTIIFTVISNYITIGNISINLSLLPVAIAGILYGPISAFIMGLINGGFIMLAPSTGLFFNISIYGTIITCLFKSALAGLISSFMYLAIRNKNQIVALIIAALAAPILNTTFFILCSLLFFKSSFGSLISLFVSINFVIELVSIAILAPAISKIILRRINQVNTSKKATN